MHHLNDLLTTQEIADQLRVSVATVNRYARIGLLRSINLPGERRYRRADVDAFIEACRIRPLAIASTSGTPESEAS